MVVRAGFTWYVGAISALVAARFKLSKYLDLQKVNSVFGYFQILQKSP